jgi:hypothetical protein
LFDLSKDIGEENDLSSQMVDKKMELIRLWEEWDQKNIAPRWHGSPTEDPTSPNPAKSLPKKAVKT